MREPKGKTLGVSFRAVAICLVLIVLNVYWILQIECVWHTGHATTVSLMWNVVFSIIILILINLGIKKFAPNHAFNQGEFITIYVMLSVASGIAGHDMIALLIPALTHAFWFATPENEWQDLMWRHVPRWLTVHDERAMTDYYEGESTFYTAAHFNAWLGPAIWWSVFTLVLVFVMICINVIIRKEWTENQKLSYPIIRLPLAMTRDGGTSAFFKNRLLWIGFGIAALLDIVNGLHVIYPQVPHLRVTYWETNISHFFTSKPWNAVGNIRFPMHPFLIAMGFFLPLDLSFSIWFFYLMKKVQLVMGSMMGLRSLPEFPYFNQQESGAWIALSIMALWITRSHLKKVFRKVLGLRTDLDDSNEPIKYRTAVLGIVAGMIFFVIFSYKTGMSLWFILVFFGLFFMISLAITRVRAELGPPAHELIYMNPGNILVNILGTKRIGAQNLSMVPYYYFFAARGYRGHPMPHQLEGMKMAQLVGMNIKRLVLAVSLAGFVGALASFWALQHMLYKVGAAGGPAVGHIWGQFNWLANHLNYPKEPNTPGIFFMVGGFFFTFFLMFMRMRFLWWPLHPAGYAFSTKIEYFWSCLMVATIVKWVILKYGGMKAHRQAIPFFFGVILGEFALGAFWSAISVIFQTPVYDFSVG